MLEARRAADRLGERRRADVADVVVVEVEHLEGLQLAVADRARERLGAQVAQRVAAQLELAELRRAAVGERVGEAGARGVADAARDVEELEIARLAGRERARAIS